MKLSIPILNNPVNPVYPSLLERTRLKANDASPFDATPRFFPIHHLLHDYRIAHSARFILRTRHVGKISEWKARRGAIEGERQNRPGPAAEPATNGRSRGLSLRLRRGHCQLACPRSC